jgi:hypothetical protein
MHTTLKVGTTQADQDVFGRWKGAGGLTFSCWICVFSWLPSFVVTEAEMTCKEHRSLRTKHRNTLGRCKSGAWLRGSLISGYTFQLQTEAADPGALARQLYFKLSAS